jgi:DNA ligase D-like protein (predicted 3'-phosphoesterase)
VSEPLRAVRITVSGRVQGVGYRDFARRRALELGVRGWVRNASDGTVALHAEGPPDAIESFAAALARPPHGASVDELASAAARVEGHEQFAIRGVAAGMFVVREHAASSRHFDLRLELGGAMRSWALPRGPSLDPAVKRLAVPVADHALDQGVGEDGRAIVWDRGVYERGGRVPWPAALERGHAVFVLHGSKLRGGFALQRTGAQWLLIKRRDEHAQPGSDVVAEQPASVLSGRTLDELLRDAG